MSGQRFKPGDRVVLVAREPYCPSPEFVGKTGTFVEYVPEPLNSSYNTRFGLSLINFARVDWDEPMLTMSGKMITKHCLMEIHLDPLPRPPAPERGDVQTDYIPPAVRKIFEVPAPKRERAKA